MSKRGKARPIEKCRRAVAILLLAGLPAGALAGNTAVIQAVGAETQYADVIAQIGGRYVHVTAIESDPNTDPHSFEISARIATAIAAANLVVENGLGYDSWADKIIAAAPNAARRVINVQRLRGLPDDSFNPHLWYDPATMPEVAKAVATDLAALQPDHAAYFAANETTFEMSLRPWLKAIAALQRDFPGAPVAVTEPVADDLLQAVGAEIATPENLQAAIMNGNDPAPQDVATQNALFTDHKVRVLVYNQQVTDPLTDSFKTLAGQNAVPLVAVYETMPAGYHYQDWMLAETVALGRALADKTSTATLQKAP